MNIEYLLVITILSSKGVGASHVLYSINIYENKSLLYRFTRDLLIVMIIIQYCIGNEIT